MKKTLFFTLMTTFGLYTNASAQNEQSGALQKATLNMDEVLGASLFSDNGNGGGSEVDIPLGGVDALSEGIESPEIKITLQCTADFDVSVASSSENFTYTGPSNINNVMPVKDVLSIIITDNETGGSIGSGFDEYQNINGTQNQVAIRAGQRGVRNFAFKYMAKPGFKYSAGIYTTDIIYTITKK